MLGSLTPDLAMPARSAFFKHELTVKPENCRSYGFLLAFLLPFIFMFACSLAFMLSWTFAFAAWVAVGLGDAVTVVLAFALLFEFSAVLQAPPKTAKVSKVRKPVIRRISIPPVVQRKISLGATKFFSLLFKVSASG